MSCGNYTVEKVVGKRVRDGSKKYIYSDCVEYKVKWLGYPSHQNTWEPLKHLKNVMELVEDFE